MTRYVLQVPRGAWLLANGRRQRAGPHGDSPRQSLRLSHAERGAPPRTGRRTAAPRRHGRRRHRRGDRLLEGVKRATGSERCVLRHRPRGRRDSRRGDSCSGSRRTDAAVRYAGRGADAARLAGPDGRPEARGGLLAVGMGARSAACSRCCCCSAGSTNSSRPASWRRSRGRHFRWNEYRTRCGRLRSRDDRERCCCGLVSGEWSEYYSHNANKAPLPYHSPLTTHHSPLTTHHSPLTTHHSPLTTHHSPLTTHHSPLTTHHSPLTTHHSPLTTHHSPLTTHHSPLTTHHSPLTTHHSPLTTHHSPMPFAST